MAIGRSFLYSIPLIGSLLSASASASASSPDIHDILPSFKLPKGILPGVPNTYTLSPKDGTFTAHLQHPCYVKFDDQLVYYGPLIKGQLTSGNISNVSGIQARIFFIWVSVTGMRMDMDADMLEFHVGALSHKLPANYFRTIPPCLHNPSSSSSSSSSS